MAGSLRDQLTAAVDQIETGAPVETPEPSKEAPAQSGTPRGEDGKFTKAEKAANEAAKTEQKEEPKPIKRPTSWKKDYWEHFDKLDEPLRNYILQREDEQTRGISNFRAEAEKAKKLWDAIAPFQADLDRFGVAPEKHIADLFNAHRTLALADPQSKLAMFAKLAQDYQVPLQALMGGQGQMQMDPYMAQLTRQVNALTQSWQDAQRRAEQEQQASVANEVQSFASNSEKYPHFEQVRLKMAGLLQAGEAEDLEDAYSKAIRLDDNLYEQMLEAKHAEKVTAERKAKDEAAKAAKAKAVSVATSTPGPQAAAGVKGIRGALEAAVEQHIGGGRV